MRNSDLLGSGCGLSWETVVHKRHHDLEDGLCAPVVRAGESAHPASVFG